MIVWVDTETTGLDERTGQLLEVAFVVTDDALVERAATSVVIAPVAPLDMSLVVQEMHEKSGLLKDIKDGCSLPAANKILKDWLAATFGRVEDLRQIPLAGSTVGFDRRWLRQHLPAVEALFSYRSIDVSALTELSSRWSPAVYNNRPKKDAGIAHRALDDARQSAECLAYYRQAGFIG